jgi:hypothetical protein
MEFCPNYFKNGAASSSDGQRRHILPKRCVEIGANLWKSEVLMARSPKVHHSFSLSNFAFENGIRAIARQFASCRSVANSSENTAADGAPWRFMHAVLQSSITPFAGSGTTETRLRRCVRAPRVGRYQSC